MATWSPVFPDLLFEWDTEQTLKFSNRNGHRLRLRASAEEPRRRRVEVEFVYVYGFQFHYGFQHVSEPEDLTSLFRTVYRSNDTPALDSIRSTLEGSGERWTGEIHHYRALLGHHWLEVMAIECQLQTLE